MVNGWISSGMAGECRVRLRSKHPSLNIFKISDERILFSADIETAEFTRTTENLAKLRLNAQNLQLNHG